MLHPVGSRPPSVYWRRRLLLLASLVLLVLLVVLTVKAVFSDDGGSPAAQADGTTHPVTSPRTTPSSTPTSTAGSSHASTSAHPPTSTAHSSSAVPAQCKAAQLSVQAVVGKSQYKVGDNPVLTLQVTNTGPAPCVQNVADSQIELRVYNGASRVWGSHDCKVEPGVDDRTLAVGRPAGFSIEWSGLTAQPGCAGTRQRVGAGTYTLYAALSGHDGKVAQFSIH
jgi:hypothetical protein